MTESFDAVLADADALAAAIGRAGINGFGNQVADLRDRLAAAHAAELGERDARIAWWETHANEAADHAEHFAARAEAAEQDARRLDWMDRALAERGRMEFKVRDPTLPSNVRQVIDAAIDACMGEAASGYGVQT